MRLIDTTSLTIHELFPPDIPPYAILSHRWGTEEVSLQEFTGRRSIIKKKAGYTKISSAANIARKRGLAFIWIDTCCIDKNNGSELAEAINSMYLWYQQAETCYVFLQDLAPTVTDDELTRSSWFARGWTLQELVAPRRVLFLDQKWNCRGCKSDYVDAISTLTNIPARVLRGEDSPSDYSVAFRMSWAASRKTTRVEDMAYCLLGIMDVNMPLVYGEGMRAFRRLQEEIAKRNCDWSIFAWESPAYLRLEETHTSLEQNKRVGCLFAPSPAPFAHVGPLMTLSVVNPGFVVTNVGLSVSGLTELFLTKVPLSLLEASSGAAAKEPSQNSGIGDDASTKTATAPKKMYRFVLLLGHNAEMSMGIYLVKLKPNVFQRDFRLPLAKLLRPLRQPKTSVTDWYLCIDEPQLVGLSWFQYGALRFPATGYHNENTRLIKVAPDFLWDVDDRLFLRPNLDMSNGCEMVLSLKVEVSLRNCESAALSNSGSYYDEPASADIHTTQGTAGSVACLVLLCKYNYLGQSPLLCLSPRLCLFAEKDFPRETPMLFAHRSPSNSLLWADFEVLCPQIAGRPPSITLNPRTGKEDREMEETDGSDRDNSDNSSWKTTGISKGPGEPDDLDTRYRVSVFCEISKPRITELFSNIYFKVEVLGPNESVCLFDIKAKQDEARRVDKRKRRS